MAGPGGEEIVKKASCLRAVLRPGSPRSEEWKNMLPRATLTSVGKVAMSVAGVSKGSAALRVAGLNEDCVGVVAYFAVGQIAVVLKSPAKTCSRVSHGVSLRKQADSWVSSSERCSK